ncbi:MAG: DUF4747 family protein [Verrucomicrobia bacterium]|nr:DUF4747 family protein [Verrucomicrobiota bacterium]
MSKLRQLTVSAINLALPPPHSPERYTSLWRAIFNAKQPVSVHGDIHLIVGNAISLDKNEHSAPIRGTIYRYIEINKGAPWFNAETAEFADAQTIKNQVILPAHLKPNSKAFNYLFVPSVHRLFFESLVPVVGSLSPLSVEKLVEGLVGLPAISARFPDVQVTV